jgi:hypothetical protein
MHIIQGQAQQNDISNEQFLKALSDPRELELIRQQSLTIYTAMIALLQKHPINIKVRSKHSFYTSLITS